VIGGIMSLSKFVLQTTGLSKRYKRIHAVKNLSLNIKRGSVFGLLGPNGSGKTTTLGMILGVINPSRGDYIWFEKDNSHKQRQNIGAILEKPNFYPHLSAFKNLQIVSMIKNVKTDKIENVLKKVNLYERRNDKFKTFSLGMKQRLAIAAALIADPHVLVLDEPTNGLDPQGISDIRELIIEISQSGKTIILASHLLDEVQKVCTEFAVLQKGELIHHGSVDDNFSDEINIEVAAQDMSTLENTLKTHKKFKKLSLKKEFCFVSLEKGVTPEEFGKWLFENEIVLTHLNFVKKNLEQKFLEIVEKAND
jgi:ABC-2 type transport system ATP-binding protein